MEEYLVVIRGQSVSGARSILRKLKYDVFDPTIDDYIYEHTLLVDNVNTKLFFYFGDRSDDYFEFRKKMFSEANGFIVMYSIDFPYSFENAERLCTDIVKERGNQIPLVICGNKCDLEDQRIISQFQGKILAKKFGANFFETSAKENINIYVMFSTLIRMMRSPKDEKPKKICTTY